MFSFFKRIVVPPESAARENEVGLPPRAAVPGVLPAVAPAEALPEVHEGDDDAAWALWEDSVMSQNASLTANDIAPTKPTPLTLEDDPFASVRKRSS